MTLFAHFQWDPSRVFFEVPYVDFPIYWYGFLFALGYHLMYLFLRTNLRQLADPGAKEPSMLLSSLTLWIPIFSIVGARLAYVLFYGLPIYLAHPAEIWNLRQGGLASHGAMAAIVIVVYCCVRRYSRSAPRMTFWAVLDLLAIPVGWAAALIRIGNFINQEILGTPTNMPWGVEFLHPLEPVQGIVHPVQLYEGIGYAATATLLWMLWRRRPSWLGQGLFVALLLIAVTTIRFLCEFWKAPQGSGWTQWAGLSVGQWLSLPWLFFGVALLVRGWRRIDPVHITK